MYEFPQLISMTIENFSRFQKKNPLSIHFDREVHCIAGANGLGNSTFIYIINFAFTGIVPNPARSFSWYNSLPLYKLSRGFLIAMN